MSKRGATEQLASDIETLTGACWGREQRLEICEMLRKYRFQAVGANMLKLQKLIEDSGHAELSSKIFLGKLK